MQDTDVNKNEHPERETTTKDKIYLFILKQFICMVIAMQIVYFLYVMKIGINMDDK